MIDVDFALDAEFGYARSLCSYLVMDSVFDPQSAIHHRACPFAQKVYQVRNSIKLSRHYQLSVKHIVTSPCCIRFQH